MALSFMAYKWGVILANRILSGVIILQEGETVDTKLGPERFVGFFLGGCAHVPPSYMGIIS